MDTTSNLRLPYIMASQAQKHVTHNESLRKLDAIVQLAVLDRDLSAPPVPPAEGSRYIVAPGASGAWTGHDGEIAAYQDGAWAFHSAQLGWIAWVADEAAPVAWDGASWIAAGGSINPAALVGINTVADATNRLAVKSDAILLSHDDVTPGSGDLRTILNKATAGDTASFLLQTGFSGRAEVGLAGDDDLHVKVSGDGSVWHEALVADKATGKVKFPSGIAQVDTGQLLTHLLPCAVVGQLWRSDASRLATPRTYTIDSVSGSHIDLATASVDQIFTSDMRNTVMVRIWNVSKSPAQSAWVDWNNSTTQLNVASAADIATWAPGETVQLGDPNPTGTNTLGMVALDISNYLFNAFGAVFRQRGVLLSTYASATGGDATIDGSGSGALGSAAGTASMPDGKRNYGSHTFFTTQLSPVSNSNLLFLRESLGTGSALAICYLRLVGVYV